MVRQKEKVMDQIQRQIIAQQFKEKYAEELDTNSGLRRKFSSAFKTDLVSALKESGLSQREFSESIGVSVSVIENSKRIVDQLKKSDIRQDFCRSNFKEIQVESPPVSASAEIYLQHPSGIRVYGFNWIQLRDLLKVL